MADESKLGTAQKTALGCGLATLVFIVVVVLIVLNSASCQRELKSIHSDFGGGIERTVTIYDYNGNVVREWHGTFDIAEDNQEVYFDLDGKRIIVQGGIIVIEEETAEEYEARVAARDAA